MPTEGTLWFDSHLTVFGFLLKEWPELVKSSLELGVECGWLVHNVVRELQEVVRLHESQFNCLFDNLCELVEFIREEECCEFNVTILESLLSV